MHHFLITILFLLPLLSPPKTHAQTNTQTPKSTAFFKYDRLTHHGDSLMPRHIWFEINGQPIKDRSKIHEIPIRPDALDEVIIHYGRKKDLTHHAVAHFIPGQSYRFLGNPCSGWELKPAKPVKAKIGRVRVKVVHGKDLQVEAALGHSEQIDSIYNEKTTAYYQCYGSAMCMFVPYEVSLWERQAKEKLFKLANFSYLFLQGEKLTVTWDYSTNKLSIRVDGYIQKGEKAANEY
ncbi:MAG: hypothetical protein AAF570_22315 [Bacteroidota bacterium]